MLKDSWRIFCLLSRQLDGSITKLSLSLSLQSNSIYHFLILVTQSLSSRKKKSFGKCFQHVGNVVKVYFYSKTLCSPNPIQVFFFFLCKYNEIFVFVLLKYNQVALVPKLNHV